VVAGSAINGLVDIKFDNGNHYLVAEAAGGVRYRAPVGDTGTWASAENVTTGAYLDAVHYQNKYFLLNGANLNRVWYLPATAVSTTPSFRQHGMNPVISAPGISTAAGTATVDSAGYYEYWTTEVAHIFKDAADYNYASATVNAAATGAAFVTGAFGGLGISAGDTVNGTLVFNNTTVVSTSTTSVTIDRGTVVSGNAILTFERGVFETLESTFGANPFDPAAKPILPATVQYASTGIVANISRAIPSGVGATTFNTNATHWRVYRSPKKGAPSEQSFPTGFLISPDLPIATDSWIDQGEQAAITRSPATATADSGWADAARVTSSNDSYATLTQIGQGATGGAMRVLQYGFTTVTDPIAGIAVNVECKRNSSLTTLLVQISIDGGSNWSAPRTVVVPILRRPS
jgi:hypothetical protein